MNDLIKKVIFFSFLSFSAVNLYSQSPNDKEFIKAVQEANYYFSIEDFERAADFYYILNNKYPLHSNIASKLGICYLHIDGKKYEAFLLLKKASDNVVASEKEYEEYGEKAPWDVFLYLAHAYQLNDNFEKSISLFNDFKTKLGKNDAQKVSYIDKQIRDCKYAMEMIKKPLTMVPTLLAPWLIEYQGACNPVISKNDSVLIFTHEQNGKTSIYCSYKKSVWMQPVNITSQIGGYDRLYSNSITGDGRLLILFMDDGGDGNLYYSQRVDTTWSKIKSVGKYVNSIYWESHGFISPDGNTMFFASNRPGGEGNLDIWKSERANDGSWERPENCGKVINTPYHENTPFFDPESKSLIFSSMGHSSMGGYDVFSSSYNKSWTTPVGLPYPFNNTSDNIFFNLNNYGPGFIASQYNDKTRSRNIYSLVAKDSADKVTLAGGNVILLDGMDLNPEKTHIKLINKNTPELFQNIPVNDSGLFNFTINTGDYQLFVSHDRYKTDTINLSLPLNFSGNYIAIMVSLVPEKVSSGYYLSALNIPFDFNSYELSEQSKYSLEFFKSNLIEHSDLMIEVDGYSDDVGDSEYNLLLSDKRAQSVIDYLSSAGISPARFTKKALGESDFIEMNSTSEGSDYPEGRKYNRRAVVEIINPQTGIVLNNDIYTPEYLRQAYSMKYNIILIKTNKIFPPDYFNNLLLDKALYVNPVKKDTVFWYILGVFYNKPEALEYLTLAKEKGFNEALVMNQYEMNNELKSTETLNTGSRQSITQKVYIIQLLVSGKPVNISQSFKGLKGVNEIQGNDGLYKYTIGEYLSRPEADDALLSLKESGYKEASIVEVNMVVFK